MKSAPLLNRPHPCRFYNGISRYRPHISTYPFCTAAIIITYFSMRNSRLIQTWFPNKIFEVSIDRFFVCYDWWRQLQLTSSVPPVWITFLLCYRWSYGVTYQKQKIKLKSNVVKQKPATYPRNWWTNIYFILVFLFIYGGIEVADLSKW